MTSQYTSEILSKEEKEQLQKAVTSITRWELELYGPWVWALVDNKTNAYLRFCGVDKYIHFTKLCKRANRRFPV